MKVTFTEVNGHKYAYTCTSRHVAGRKNPVSKRTYLGVVDPKTGEIIPKKGASLEDVTIFNAFSVKSYGDVALVMTVIERLGLRNDYRSIFGARGDDVLAVAIAQAIHPMSSDSIHFTIKQSYICESLGLDPSRFTSKHIRSIINSITESEMNECFKQKYSRAGGLPMVFSNTISLTEGSEDSLKRMFGFPADDQVAVALAMDSTGRPVAFHLISESIQNDTGLMEFVESFKNRTGGCLYIADTVSVQNLRLPEFLIRGIDVIASFPYSSHQFISTMERTGHTNISRPLGRSESCILGEGVVGIRTTGSDYILIHKNDDDFEGCGTRLNAFLNYDASLNQTTVDAMESIIRNTKSCLNGKKTKDPVADLNRVAGVVSDLMSVRMEQDGTMRVTTKHSKVSELKTKAGLSLVLSTCDSWDDIVAIRRFRKEMMHVFRQYYHGSRWLMEYIGRGVGMTSFRMIEFTVLMIYHEIYRILKDNDFPMDIQDALYLASSMKVVITPAGVFKSDSSREARKLFEIFDIDLRDPGQDGCRCIQGEMFFSSF